MPEIAIHFSSHRGRSVDDLIDSVDVSGSHYVHPSDIDSFQGRVVLDVVPGEYTLTAEVDGFERFSVPFAARRNKPRAMRARIQHRCSVLPKYSDLNGEQQRLWLSCAGNEGGQAWRRLSDNKVCTFFQVTYALARTQAGESVLSDCIQSVKRIGGAELKGRDSSGKIKRVKGWRMHVRIKKKYQAELIDLLPASGFKADSGMAHPTHSRFGYTESYRQQGANPKLQLVFNEKFTEADVDLDNGAFHKSAPYRVYKALVKKYPEVSEVYEVS